MDESAVIAGPSMVAATTSIRGADAIQTAIGAVHAGIDDASADCPLVGDGRPNGTILFSKQSIAMMLVRVDIICGGHEREGLTPILRG